MVALRDLGNIALALRNDKCEFPETLPKPLRASALARDGWGREIAYLRMAGDEAYLLSLGADGRQDVEVRKGMALSPEFPKQWLVKRPFPASDFDHDIVYKLSLNGDAGFIIHPDGVATGESCILLSAFGCFAY